MSTFVLVHGAWQSTGTWDLLAPLLEKHGHKVVTPVLSGLGTDQSRLSPGITLQQHVEDVSRELSKLRDQVILVGHSYAGMIISGAGRDKPKFRWAIGFPGCLHPGKWAKRTGLATS